MRCKAYAHHSALEWAVYAPIYALPYNCKNIQPNKNDTHPSRRP